MYPVLVFISMVHVELTIVDHCEIAVHLPEILYKVNRASGVNAKLFRRFSPPTSHHVQHGPILRQRPQGQIHPPKPSTTLNVPQAKAIRLKHDTILKAPGTEDMSMNTKASNAILAMASPISHATGRGGRPRSAAHEPKRCRGGQGGLLAVEHHTCSPLREDTGIKRRNLFRPRRPFSIFPKPPPARQHQGRNLLSK